MARKNARLTYTVGYKVFSAFSGLRIKELEHGYRLLPATFYPTRIAFAAESLERWEGHLAAHPENVEFRREVTRCRRRLTHAKNCHRKALEWEQRRDEREAREAVEDRVRIVEHPERYDDALIARCRAWLQEHAPERLPQVEPAPEPAPVVDTRTPAEKRTTWVAMCIGLPEPLVLHVGARGETRKEVHAKAISVINATAPGGELFLTTKSECIRYYQSAWNAYYGA